MLLLLDLVLLASLTVLQVKGEELPPCPTSLLLFPQALPLHCRMLDTKMTPRPAKPPVIHFPISPPIFPSAPGAPVPLPPGPMVPAMPGPVPMPGLVPLMSAPPRLPVIVMPFYSQVHKEDNRKKRKRPRWQTKGRGRGKGRGFLWSDDTATDTDTDSSDTDDEYSSDSDSSDGYRRRMQTNMHHRRKIRRRSGQSIKNSKGKGLLTPVIQYLTDDGYLIYEKELSDDQAKRWLSEGKKKIDSKKVASAELKHVQDEHPGDDTVYNEENVKNNGKKQAQKKIIKQAHKTQERDVPARHSGVKQDDDAVIS